MTPSLVAEVTFAEWTGDNKIRHPSFQGLRRDKAPREIIRERGASAPTHTREAAAPDAPSDRLVFDIDPGPRVGWKEVIAAARATRSLARILDVPAAPVRAGLQSDRWTLNMSSAIIRAGAVFDRPHLEDFMAKKRSGSKRAQSRGRKTSGRSAGRKGAAKKRGARKTARKGAAKARKGAAKKGASRKAAARKGARKTTRRSTRAAMGAAGAGTELGPTTAMPDTMGDLGAMPADFGDTTGGRDEDEM